MKTQPRLAKLKAYCRYLQLRLTRPDLPIVEAKILSGVIAKCKDWHQPDRSYWVD